MADKMDRSSPKYKPLSKRLENMQSNSKLNAHQKLARKEFKAKFLNAGGVLVLVGAVTVALERTGVTSGHFAVSIASPDERKIRRKVGEFYALARVDQYATMPVQLWTAEEATANYGSDAEYLELVASDIASALQP